MEWRRRLALSPWWVLALVSGVPFAAMMVVWSGLSDGHWVAAASVGIPSGVLFGLVMGPLTARRNRRLLNGVQHVSLQSIRLAIRDARRGRVPEDDDLRIAALTLARRQHDLLLRTRRWGAVVFGVGLVAYCVFAVTSSPWWLLAAATFGTFIAVSWWSPRSLRRQIRVLEHGGHGPAVTFVESE